MSFRILLPDQGTQFNANAGETLLAAGLRQGVPLPYGCRDGACGSCRVRLLDGAVDYPEGQPAALSPAAEAEGAVLLCRAAPISDLSLAVPAGVVPGTPPLRRIPCRVAAIEHLADDVVRLRLKQPAAQRLAYRAGQYVEVLLKDGRRRGFSLAGAPGDGEHLELHVRLLPGGAFTRYVTEELRERDILRIEGPLGGFHLRGDSDRPVLLVGGGTGFAPLKAILEQAFDQGVRRPMHLFWGARARADLYLDALPRRWQSEQAAFRYTPVLSAPGPDWDGAAGLVTDAVAATHTDLSGHDIYMSGPPAMVEAGRRLFTARGARPERIFADAFAPAAPGSQKPTMNPRDADKTG